MYTIGLLVYSEHSDLVANKARYFIDDTIKNADESWIFYAGGPGLDRQE